MIPAHIYDPVNRRIIDGTIQIVDGHISAIEPAAEPLPADAPCVLPGFVDAHIHIESSMLLPENFASAAVPFGTVATVSDPHEIANVLGMEGVAFMAEHGRKSPMHFCFGAPSCVPSTGFETAGATLDAEAVAQLMQRQDIGYLAEVMAVPSVIYQEPDMMAKLQAAKNCNKPIDGHAPSVDLDTLTKYAAAGITTNHECTTLEEGRANIRQGIKVLLREGSAAKDFDALMPLIAESPDMVMFCSDDKHPDELVKGHINLLVKRALEAGMPLWNVLQAASVNPVRHYNLPVGLLQVGDSADFIVVDNLRNLTVTDTYICGIPYNNSHPLAVEDTTHIFAPNNFHAQPLSEEDLRILPQGDKMRCIVARDRMLLTDSITVTPKVDHGNVVSDTQNDVLKIVVYNRYELGTKPAIGFIRGFGLKVGALGATVAHDSHNIIAVGATDQAIVSVVNQLVAMKGGLAVCDREGKLQSLPLPVAGLISLQPAQQVADDFTLLTQHLLAQGCRLEAPFMTLGFMALPVIPALKMTDKGLFRYDTFNHTPLFE